MWNALFWLFTMPHAWCMLWTLVEKQESLLSMRPNFLWNKFLKYLPLRVLLAIKNLFNWRKRRTFHIRAQISNWALMWKTSEIDKYWFSMEDYHYGHPPGSLEIILDHQPRPQWSSGQRFTLYRSFFTANIEGLFNCNHTLIQA